MKKVSFLVRCEGGNKGEGRKKAWGQDMKGVRKGCICPFSFCYFPPAPTPPTHTSPEARTVEVSVVLPVVLQLVHETLGGGVGKTVRGTREGEGGSGGGGTIEMVGGESGGGLMLVVVVLRSSQGREVEWGGVMKVMVWVVVTSSEPTFPRLHSVGVVIKGGDEGGLKRQTVRNGNMSVAVVVMIVHARIIPKL